MAEFAKNPDSLVSRYSQNHSEDNILKDRPLDDLALNIHINSEAMRKKMNIDKPVLLAEKLARINLIAKQIENGLLVKFQSKLKKLETFQKEHKKI